MAELGTIKIDLKNLDLVKEMISIIEDSYVHLPKDIQGRCDKLDGFHYMVKKKKNGTQVE